MKLEDAIAIAHAASIAKYLEQEQLRSLYMTCSDGSCQGLWEKIQETTVSEPIDPDFDEFSNITGE